MAISIDLTQNKVSIIDNEMFPIVSNFKWYAIRKTNGSFYAGHQFRLNTNNHYVIKLHHFIIGHPLKGFEIDHINGDGLDNRRSNLRIVTHRENTLNQKCHRNGSSSSKFPGVYFCKRTKKWTIIIRIDGKSKYFGRFKDEKKAGEIANQIYCGISLRN